MCRSLVVLIPKRDVFMLDFFIYATDLDKYFTKVISS